MIRPVGENQHRIVVYSYSIMSAKVLMGASLPINLLFLIGSDFGERYILINQIRS